MYCPCKVEDEILGSPHGQGLVALQSEAPGLCPGEAEGMLPAWVDQEETSYSRSLARWLRVSLLTYGN